MSFHKKIEEQLAREFSTNEATDLIDYQDAVFYGRQLQAAEMSRVFGLGWKGAVKAAKGFVKAFRQAPIASLDNHIRQDIGLAPKNGATAGRGYM